MSDISDVDIDYVKYTLADYFEDAGFADVYNRKIKDMSSEDAVKLFKETFGEDEPVFEDISE